MKKSRIAIFFLCVILLVASLSAFTACNPEQEDELEPHPIAGIWVGYREGDPNAQFYMVVEATLSEKNGEPEYFYRVSSYRVKVISGTTGLTIEFSAINNSTTTGIQIIGEQEFVSINSYLYEVNSSAFNAWSVSWLNDDRITLTANYSAWYDAPPEYHFKRDAITLEEWQQIAIETNDDGFVIINALTGNPVPYFYEENN